MSRSAILFLATLLFVAAPARACNIPVYRYALERWRNDQPEDRYQISIFQRGPLNDADAKLVQGLRKLGEGRHALAPCVVETVDLADKIDAAKQQLWQTQTDAVLPWIVVQLPESAEDRAPLWSAHLDEPGVQRLTDSPARREVARRLLQGETMVWIYLETGDAKEDERLDKQVVADLGRLEKTLKLPDAEDTVPLLSKLPLGVKLSLLRVKRDDPQEVFFVASLLRSIKETVKPTEPLLFPIFGRGRVLDGLIGKGINADNLKDAGQFLCGPCSCQVKRLNPGMDLLIAADWDAVLTDPDAIEPEPPHMREQSVPLPAKKSEPAAEQPPPGPNLLLLIALGVGSSVVVVAIGFALRAKRKQAATKEQP